MCITEKVLKRNICQERFGLCDDLSCGSKIKKAWQFFFFNGLPLFDSVNTE